jgi:hypothetical protein
LIEIDLTRNDFTNFKLIIQSDKYLTVVFVNGFYLPRGEQNYQINVIGNKIKKRPLLAGAFKI